MPIALVSVSIGAVQHVLLGGLVVHRRQVLVDPAVDADLVAPAGEDRRDHLRMQQVADRRDEERRRQLVLVEQPQDARQAVDGAVTRRARSTPRSDCRSRASARRVVDVEAEADRHPRAVGPRRRLQPLAGADVEHLRFDLASGSFTPGCGRACAQSVAAQLSATTARRDRAISKSEV